MEVTGIILADGKNLKLDGNKGTEIIGGIPVIERVIKSLTPITNRIILVTGGDSITFSTLKSVEVITDNYPHKKTAHRHLYRTLLFPYHRQYRGHL